MGGVHLVGEVGVYSYISVCIISMTNCVGGGAQILVYVTRDGHYRFFGLALINIPV